MFRAEITRPTPFSLTLLVEPTIVRPEPRLFIVNRVACGDALNRTLAFSLVSNRGSVRRSDKCEDMVVTTIPYRASHLQKAAPVGATRASKTASRAGSDRGRRAEGYEQWS